MKIAIVTDSTSYIPKAMRESLGIHMVPLSVVMGGETYREEIDVTYQEFYEVVRTSEQLPTTSQPPIGEFVQLFENLRDQGYTHVISILLSSGISGTYQSVVSAGDMVEGIETVAFDSEISCMPQGFYVLEAAEMAQNGQTAEVILEKLEEMKKSLRAYFMVDDLSHLQRGGRLSSAQAFIGSLLQVKPLLHFQEKVIVPFEKIRTKKKALKRIEELLQNDIQTGERFKACIIHANREEEAVEWKNELEAKYPNVEWMVSYFGPVIGTHLGEGSLGMSWVKAE